MIKQHSKMWGLLVALLLAITSGCGLDGPQSAMSPAGPVAQRQLDTFYITLWVSIAIFAVMGTLLVYCIAKFRVKEDDLPDEFPEQGHGGAALEIGIILVSVGLVAIMAIPTLFGIFWVGTLPQDEGVFEIKVMGYQWWWSFEYPEQGVITGNECAIPIGQPVKFTLETNDVLHSFWVPRLGGKVDLMTGQTNWLWLEADASLNGATPIPEGNPIQGHYFYGQCAEFCGESHAFMRFRVLALDDDNFQKWISLQKEDAVDPVEADAIAGKANFVSNNCGSCHTIRGHAGCTGKVGPDLTHLGSRVSIAAGMRDNTVEELESWITAPHKLKPGNIMYSAGYQAMNIELDANEVKTIATYLHSLK